MERSLLQTQPYRQCLSLFIYNLSYFCYSTGWLPLIHIAGPFYSTAYFFPQNTLPSSYKFSTVIFILLLSSQTFPLKKINFSNTLIAQDIIKLVIFLTLNVTHLPPGKATRNDKRSVGALYSFRIKINLTGKPRPAFKKVDKRQINTLILIQIS